MRRWRAILALAWRESRGTRRRLLLFTTPIAVGVAALVAIDSYSANVASSVRAQSRALLGADLALTSRRPFPDSIAALLDSLGRAGAGVGRRTSFISMAVLPRTGDTRLVQVRAVSPGVPFYGTVETSPALAWRELQRGARVLVDSALLGALNARVGDTLSLGDARLAIWGTAKPLAGDLGIESALGPRVYIPERLVASTGLLRFGSRAEYEALLRLPANVNAERLVTRIRPRLQSAQVRARTVADAEEDLTEAVAQLDRFLGLVGLVALLLGGTGVASAVHAYMAEKTDTVAVLRCLGATAPQVLGIYAIEAATLGLVSSLAGVVLGVAAQMALPGLVGRFVPVDVAVRLEPAALAMGLGTGVLVSVLFALGPLLVVRRISPLQTLRREAAAAPRARSLAERWLAYGALAAGVVAVTALRAATWMEALAMSAGIGAALLVLWAVARALSWAARVAARERWPFVLRQGIANLHRPANQTQAVMLALGFGAFLVSTLYLAQASLVAQLARASQATAANLAFFDVQPDQVGALDSLLAASGAPVVQRVPIIPMRIAAVNGAPTSTLGAGRDRWALRREYRSSVRDTLIDSERLVAGRWFRPPADTARERVAEVSFEQEVASELQLGPGDTVTWDVQGVRVPTVVTSLRAVNWARFEPNFFAIFEPAALRDAPRTFVVLTRGATVAARAALQREAVRVLPNVSSIDLSALQDTLDAVLTRVMRAVRFLALFSLAIGALVLLSAVAASRRQRVREGVLLKTLGATRAQVSRILLAEYLALGALGSATGIVLSVAAAWGLARFVFRVPLVVPGGPLLALAAGLMALALSIGWLASRHIFAETPVAALREA